MNFLELKMFQASGLGEPCLGFLHGQGCEHGDRAREECVESKDASQKMLVTCPPSI